MRSHAVDLRVERVTLRENHRGGYFASCDAAHATHLVTLDQSFSAQQVTARQVTLQLSKQAVATAPTAESPTRHNAAPPTLSARRGLLLGLATGLGIPAFTAARV